MPYFRPISVEKNFSSSKLKCREHASKNIPSSWLTQTNLFLCLLNIRNDPLNIVLNPAIFLINKYFEKSTSS